MSKCIFVVEVNYLQIMLSTFRFVLKLSNICHTNISSMRNKLYVTNVTCV